MVRVVLELRPSLIACDATLSTRPDVAFPGFAWASAEPASERAVGEALDEDRT